VQLAMATARSGSDLAHCNREIPARWGQHVASDAHVTVVADHEDRPVRRHPRWLLHHPWRRIPGGTACWQRSLPRLESCLCGGLPGIGDRVFDLGCGPAQTSAGQPWPSPAGRLDSCPSFLTDADRRAINVPLATASSG
jgi:hypothetical protein